LNQKNYVEQIVRMLKLFAALSSTLNMIILMVQ